MNSLKKISFIAFALMLMVGLQSPQHVKAQNVDQESVQTQLAEEAAELKERLNLTEDQIEQMRPVLENSVERRLAILEKYDIDLENRDPDKKKPGYRTLRKMRKDMNKSREQTNKELSNILSDEQLKEYKKIQDERKDKMRAKLKERRG